MIAVGLTILAFLDFLPLRPFDVGINMGNRDTKLR